MASRYRLRSLAQISRELDDVANQDYLGQFPQKGSRITKGAKGPISKKQAAEAPLIDRASRANSRAVTKRGHPEAGGPEIQAAAVRRGKRRRMAQEREEDGDEQDEEEEDGVDHDRTAQAINQARHRPQQTVNGIGAHQDEQSQGGDDEEEEEDGQGEGEDEERLSMRQAFEEPRGRKSNTAPDGHGRASMLHGHISGPPTRTSKEHYDAVYGFQESPVKNLQRQQRASAGRVVKNRETAPRPSNRPSTHPQPVQHQESSDDSASCSEGEARGDTTGNMAEDSAFIEAPRPNEELLRVEVSIHGIGGIVKTLQHQAWTNRSDWARDFESNGKSDDDAAACRTVLGRAFIKATMGLKGLLDNAIDIRKGSEDGDDDLLVAIEYLRERSDDTKRHLARINKAVEDICAEGLAPPAPAADEAAEQRAIKTRQRLLRDVSRRLIPMFVLLIKTACDLVLIDNKKVRMTIELNSFTLQFFLRILGWTGRLHKALIRGLQDWPFEAEFIKDEQDLNEEEREARQGKIEARFLFEQQLARLNYSAKGAERHIQDEADHLEKQRREAVIRTQRLERSRLFQAAKKREEEEKRQRDARSRAAFANWTQQVRHTFLLQEQAARERASRRASAQSIAPHSRSHGQRTSGTGTPRAGPSSKAQIEGDVFDYDPYADNRQPTQASRPWTYEEEKALVKSIRYDKTYNLASMAVELGRSESDVARKVASVKQGYRSVYAKRGQEIPAWAF